jgi:hypothetical protein
VDHIVIPKRLLLRARGEYLEMPGLRLTLAQATRLWGLEQGLALALMEALVETGFLARTGDGRYCRRGDVSPLERSHGD